jgi:diacylglycerol kinase family enzyme
VRIEIEGRKIGKHVYTLFVITSSGTLPRNQKSLNAKNRENMLCKVYNNNNNIIMLTHIDINIDINIDIDIDIDIEKYSTPKTHMQTFSMHLPTTPR